MSKASLQYDNLKTTREIYASEGRCIDCGAPRGLDGTTVRCRPCANKVNAHNAAVRKRAKARRLEAKQK